MQYETEGLERDDLAADPMVQWHAWHSDAFEGGLAEPNAMVLSTIDVHGHPDEALVDGSQALVPDELVDLGKELAGLSHALGRPFAGDV